MGAAEACHFRCSEARNSSFGVPPLGLVITQILGLRREEGTNGLSSGLCTVSCILIIILPSNPSPRPSPERRGRIALCSPCKSAFIEILEVVGRAEPKPNCG